MLYFGFAASILPNIPISAAVCLRKRPFSSSSVGAIFSVADRVTSASIAAISSGEK